MNPPSATHFLPLPVILLCAILYPPALAADGLRERTSAVFGVIEPVTRAEIEAPRAALGRALFWDTRLSANGNTACASCHAAEGWGSDRRLRSLDARGKLTGRHSQSVLNAMGVSAEHYAQAMQAYQETLRTPGPFDDWLNGDDTALDEHQRRGLESFIDRGCAACHSGPLFGGGSLQCFGVVEDYRPLTGSTGNDNGLMDKCGSEADRDIFRVQPLRNVAQTAPYFHDGSVAELSDAVAVMARVQLGQALSQEEVQGIVRFLEALGGPVPGHYGPPSAN